MASEIRSVAEFDSVELKGVGDLFIEQGEQESLSIEGEDDIIHQIITEVVDRKLVIRFDTWTALRLWGTSQNVAFHLSARDLSAIMISGSGSVALPRLKTDSLELSLTGAGSMVADVEVTKLKAVVAGSGDFTVRGSAEDVEVRIAGAGSFRGVELDSQDVRVSIGGAGKASVKAAKTLDIQIGGAGSVEYVGTPALTQKIGGIGKIERVEA
ncbi:MAG: DUF2807 domain-containing protein [Actinomycetota bacterium]|jgi:hypothetical protein|nr:DUF2807 domain-containing protein [Actinomycetota bacterium]